MTYIDPQITDPNASRILTTPGAVAWRTVGSITWRGECHKYPRQNETYEAWQALIPGGQESYFIWQSSNDGFSIATDRCDMLEQKKYPNPVAAMIAADSLDHAHWLLRK